MIRRGSRVFNNKIHSNTKFPTNAISINSNRQSNSTVICPNTCTYSNSYAHNIQKRTIVTSRILKSSKDTQDGNTTNTNTNANANANTNTDANANDVNPNVKDKIHPSVAENIGAAAKNYTLELNKVYMEAEKNLMIR